MVRAAFFRRFFFHIRVGWETEHLHFSDRTNTGPADDAIREDVFEGGAGMSVLGSVLHMGSGVLIHLSFGSLL